MKLEIIALVISIIALLLSVIRLVCFIRDIRN